MERQFNSFINQTPNLVWVVDELSTLLFASKAFYKYFGLKAAESVNKNIIDLVPESVAKSLYEKHIQVLETGMPAEFIEKVKWADGTDFIFHINIFIIEGISNKRILGDMLSIWLINMQQNKSSGRQMSGSYC